MVFLVSASNKSGASSSAEPPLVAVVDDDPSVLRSLRSLLLSSGFRVQTFQSAAAFLASAQTTAAGCLVLDLSMPGMTGSDLVSHLGRTCRPVPFVVLTAVADPAALWGCSALVASAVADALVIHAASPAAPAPHQIQSAACH